MKLHFLLKLYFLLQEKIYEHFGYVEDWVVIPLEDATCFNWILREDGDGHGQVFFSLRELTTEIILDGNAIFSNEIYTQCFLKKWVYRTEDYTMICVDTKTDGNKFLQIFDNSKEVKSPTQAQLDALRKW